jgi:hypothetical protein
MQPPEEQTSRRGILGAIVLFALGFLLMASLLHLSLHDPLHLHADARSEKLLMLDHLHGTVFSAVFGSSHVNNGFDPRAFDQSLAGSPAQTHTVNLAISGGSQSEQRVMALEFLKNLQAPPRGDACLVMLELNAGANFQNAHLVHPRSINIYDWRTTRFISNLTSPRMSLYQRVGRTGFALVASLLHYTNIGMLSNKIFSPPIDPAIMEMETADDRRGVESESQAPSASANLRHDIAEQAGHFSVEQEDLYPGNSELIAELAAASPVPNVSFVYFVYPKLDDLTAAPDYPDHITVSGHTVPIINLARPDRFPFLYKAELWHDPAHMDTEGAPLVTQLFADQLKAWYAAHGAPPQCGG